MKFYVGNFTLSQEIFRKIIKVNFKVKFMHTYHRKMNYLKKFPSFRDLSFLRIP